MKVLGIIPARGGSKAIPDKNIAILGGKPLLAYTCEAALQSKTLSRIVLNTDSEEIAAVGRDYGVEVPFMRPIGLAEDETPILPVIQHTLVWFEENYSESFDSVMLLQPTSPFRSAAHIDLAITLMSETDADTVVSVVDVPHQYNPVSVMSIDERGCLKPYVEGPMILRRQEKPRVYARNGPAILLVKVDVIRAGTLYGDAVYPLPMGQVESLDVDEPLDLELAEFYLSRLGHSE